MLSILIADQSPLVCMGIQALLNETLHNRAEIQFVISTDAFDILIRGSNLDLIILGLYKMPVMDTAYVKDRITQTQPTVPVIVYYDEFVLRTIRSFSKLGALGLISKHRVP